MKRGNKVISFRGRSHVLVKLSNQKQTKGDKSGFQNLKEKTQDNNSKPKDTIVFFSLAVQKLMVGKKY